MNWCAVPNDLMGAVRSEPVPESVLWEYASADVARQLLDGAHAANRIGPREMVRLAVHLRALPRPDLRAARALLDERWHGRTARKSGFLAKMIAHVRA